MRAFLVLMLIGALGVGAYYLRQRNTPAVPAAFSFPERVAWRFDDRSLEKPEPKICLVSGSRWRLEAHFGTRTVVAVFDGTHFASSGTRAGAPAGVFDPRTPVTEVLQTIAGFKPNATETRNGRLCWRFDQRLPGKSATAWIDVQTHFPVHLEADLPEGKPSVLDFTPLPIDLEHNADRYFDTRNLTPLLSEYAK
jgi:hypothetical protein